MNSHHCIDVCNRLLRGERSAVETYEQAVEKYRDKPEIAGQLIRTRSEHADAVRELEANVRSMSGEPDKGSGAWGAFAKSVQATANLFGADPAIESLQQGERAGKADYEQALQDDEVMPACKELMRTKLLPRIEEHIAMLERLQKAS